MKSIRSFVFCAVLAATSTFTVLARAEEADNNDEPARITAEETSTTEQPDPKAPDVDEAPPAPVKREKAVQRKPVKAARAPDGDEGGGGGSGPVPAPDPEPDPAPASPAPNRPAPNTMHCDTPPLHHINVHIRGGNGNRMIADATPIVCSTDPGTKHERYCQDTMNDDKRRCCPVKPEGHPLRVACELVLLGIDVDGVAGPRWQYVGRDPGGRVDKREDNPFLAFAYGQGTARACSNVSNVCGEGAFKVH